MIAAGSGITPMYQLLKTANFNSDSAQFGLIFANKTSKDILLKDEIDLIANEQNINFKVSYVLSQPEDHWEGLKGYVTKQMVIDTCPPPDDDTLILTCGPPVMYKKCVLPILKELGYKEENIFDF